MNDVNDPIADPVFSAAKRLSIGQTFLYAEIKAGRISALKAGRRTLITRAEQLRWLSSLPQV